MANKIEEFPLHVQRQIRAILASKDAAKKKNKLDIDNKPSLSQYGGMKKQPLPIEQIKAAYDKTGSVWKAGELLGITGQAVHYHLHKHNLFVSDGWTEAEEKRLIEYYTTTPYQVFSCESIAKELNRSIDAVQIKAGKLGVTNRSRLGSDAMKLKESASQKQAYIDNPEKRMEARDRAKKWHSEHEHPRGMLGKHHSKKFLEEQAERSRKMWKDPNCKVNSPEYRQRISDAVSAAATHRSVANAYSRCKRGFRQDIGITVRSAWEANYARYLNFLIQQREVVSWKYETTTFWFEAIKRGVRSYKPDFEVMTKNGIEYHEVKGWMDARSKTKLNRMRIYHPNVKVVLIDEKRYAALSKSVGNIIANWE